jgi:hypothetical protein
MAEIDAEPAVLTGFVVAWTGGLEVAGKLALGATTSFFAGVASETRGLVLAGGAAVGVTGFRIGTAGFSLTSFAVLVIVDELEAGRVEVEAESDTVGAVD